MNAMALAMTAAESAGAAKVSRSSAALSAGRRPACPRGAGRVREMETPSVPRLPIKK